MFYHALARILGGHQKWGNLDRASVIRDVLVPYVNRQLTLVGYDRTRALMNFGLVTYLRVYCTPHPIGPSCDLVATLSSAEFSAFECTEQILREARLERCSPESRSILQASWALALHRVFVVMKFGDAMLDDVYTNAIRPVVRDFGYDVLRIDEVQTSKSVTAELLEAIATSELILCDLTDERPNCYYETGFAHALGRELILSVHRSSPKHFDLATHRFIEWDTADELRAGLQRRLEAIRDRHSAPQVDEPDNEASDGF